MAYTQSPVISTYSTERIPAAFDLATRDTFKNNSLLLGSPGIDAGMLNLLPRKEADGSVSSEPIPETLAIQVNSGATGAIAMRGIYVWQKTSALTYYFAVVGTKVYTTTGPSVAWTNVTTFTTVADTPVGFTEFIDATNVKSLILVDGVEGYVFTSNAAGTKIVDVDFPTPHLPFPIFIDGYLFLAKKDTGDIYNCDLNTPATWTAGSFISSELYPDDVKALVKIDNYMLAVGASGCEYFYDAANPTASPMARVDGQVLPFGCSIPSSIASNKDTMVMMSNTNDGEVTIQMIQGFKTADITPSWLQTQVPIADPSYIRGFFLRTRGDLLYVLRLAGASTLGGIAPNNSFPTFAFSMSTKMWIQLSGNALTTGFPISCSAAGTSDNTISFIGGNYDGAGAYWPFFGTFGGSNFMSGFTTVNGPVNQYFTSSGTAVTTNNILTELRTPWIDFGTMNYKMNSRFTVGVLYNDGLTSLVPVAIGVYATDMAGGSGYSNTLTVGNTSADFPCLTQLGRFRQRQYKISYSGTMWIKYLFFEVDINKGNQ